MNEKQLQDKINGTIWSACDTLRTSIPGGKYKDYALTMLFVKYLSDTYKSEKEKAEKTFKGNKQMVERTLERINFKLNEECTFDYLYENRNAENIGELINKALETIQAEKASLMLYDFSDNSLQIKFVCGLPDKNLEAEIISSKDFELNEKNVSMLIAMPNKREKAELIVQKLTEI